MMTMISAMVIAMLQQILNSRCILSIRKRFEVPRAFTPLLEPKRYKGAYGGRGSAKSHFFAGELIRRCSSSRLRCVCIREVQNSIRESAERENATRNRTRRGMLGLSRLRRYARKQSTTLGGYAGPLHDINSHGADAFGEYAVNCPSRRPPLQRSAGRCPCKAACFCKVRPLRAMERGSGCKFGRAL
jgi:hypothetical protein